METSLYLVSYAVVIYPPLIQEAMHSMQHTSELARKLGHEGRAL